MQQVDVIKVQEDQKSILRQLIELYEYDFSEYNDQDVNDYGVYGYKYLDHYWTDENRYPFFVKIDNNYAGFVLINSHSYLYKDDNTKSVAEFFIMRKYRRTGNGKKVAIKIFDMFRGHWEVLQHGNNGPSKSFWKGVIEEYTKGNFELLDVETEDWKGQGYIFNNGVR
ncbi:GNAT family N-acetyltransferase [Paenibacillus dokdonensis]|uniref:GNAT family N-acetyltransferase n=1 Tax=Paenibacillus dokdonensis TaxID=2567944 RepID=UPI0010A89740|nr:GNAT family N-acetyltransferase [Paenibacillus dokdonensis]